MEKVLYGAVFLVAFLEFLISLCFNIHIYQLNYYKDKAQINWIKKNLKKWLVKNLGLIVIVVLVFCGKIGAIISIPLFFIELIINRTKKAKKPLVYTNRVKRLLITASIFYVIIQGLVIVLTEDKNLLLISTSVINLIVPVLVFVFNIMNKPINNVINKKFISKAKKIIDDMPNLTVIGVTGSYGKTSMKNFLYKLLSEKYNVLITPHNYNTTLGVTKTIHENLKATHEIFVCEMGACQVGDIKEICDIVKPKYGVITSIGEQHLETFHSVENVIKTKFELADSLPSEGMLFLNKDNEYIEKINKYKNVVSYGTACGKNKEYEAYDIKTTNSGIEFKMKDENNEEICFSTKLLGEHNAVNLAGAIAVTNKMGIPMKKLVQRVKQIESVPHRLQIINRGNNIIIDDAYNSNPNGAKSALQTLREFKGIKILVTPGMVELGEKQYELNFNFGKQATKACDYIVLVGKEQTKPIFEGIIAEKYDVNKIIIVEELKKAFEEINKISSEEQKVILLENDLPDNY